MSKEEIRRFQQVFLSYAALQERLKSTTDRESFVNLAVKLGKESGCHFTAEEVESAIDEHLQAREQTRLATVEEAIAQYEVPKQQAVW